MTYSACTAVQNTIDIKDETMYDKCPKIIRMGDPRLKIKAKPVDPTSQETHTILDNMKQAIDKVHGRGLAAPQIVISKRIVFFEIGNFRNSIYQKLYDETLEDVPFTELINPEWKPLSNEMVSGWEGCLSIPGFLGKVKRYKNIKYWFYDRNGKHHERKASGFHARLIQHEVDHLDGILFIDRLESIKLFGFKDEIVAQYGKPLV